MSILALVRNYIPAHYQVINGEWDIARIAAKCAAMPNPLCACLCILFHCPCAYACIQPWG